MLLLPVLKAQTNEETLLIVSAGPAEYFTKAVQQSVVDNGEPLCLAIRCVDVLTLLGLSLVSRCPWQSVVQERIGCSVFGTTPFVGEALITGNC